MTNPAPADDITLPALPELSYLGDDHSYGYEACDMAEYARDAVKLNCARSAGAVAAWPKDAAEVRSFFDPHCEVVQYAIDVKTPAEGDRYQLTAHDFLSAINWWADYHATPAAPPLPAAVDVGAAQAETAQAAPVVPAVVDLWYLQDTRSYVGNDVVWWAKDGKGYTTDLSKAHVYSRDAAFRQAAARGCDRAWPKAYIDGKTRPAVDMQYIDYDAARATPGATHGN